MKLNYFKNLDGFRFFCFLLVFLFHSFHSDSSAIKNSAIYNAVKIETFNNGNIGVYFFFVLSGFLITYLALQEKKEKGNIHVFKFWMRRILRIWPLYFICLVIGFIGYPLLKSYTGETSLETANIYYYISFWSNFDMIKNGLPDASILGALWSIAVEEQFYLIWPIFLYFTPIKKFWIVPSFFIGLSLVFRMYNTNYNAIEYHTLSCIGDLSIGALIAWLVFSKESFTTYLERLSTPFIYSVYSSFILLFVFRDDLSALLPSFRLIDRTIFSLIGGFIILEQTFAKNSFYKFANLKRISSLGKYTYGMYCLQFVGILIVLKTAKIIGFSDSLSKVMLIDPIFSLLVVIGLAYLSYHVFEKHFLKLKEKFK